MTRLVISTLAVGVPMGQQTYEQQVLQRAGAALGPSWQVDNVEIRTLRSPFPGTVRLPSAVLRDTRPQARRLAGAMAYRGGDVVHRLDLRLPPGRQGEVLTVHDVVPWRFPDEAISLRCARREAHRAAVVICPSSFSANELTSVLGLRDVKVIPYGVDEAFFAASPLTDAARAELGLQGPFVLHAGGATERKNLAGLAAAWERIASSERDVSLALLGPAVERKQALFRDAPRVHLLGHLPPDVARSVMASAAVIVVPSLYEGFGLPALEAMAVGVPVVASRCSSLPEVCGEAALLVAPDGAAIAAGIRAALHEDLSDLRRRGTERARRFSWESTVAHHADVWRSVV